MPPRFTGTRFDYDYDHWDIIGAFENDAKKLHIDGVIINLEIDTCIVDGRPLTDAAIFESH